MCIDVCICSVSFAISSVGAGHHVHVGAAGCGTCRMMLGSHFCSMHCLMIRRSIADLLPSLLLTYLDILT